MQRAALTQLNSPGLPSRKLHVVDIRVLAVVVVCLLFSFLTLASAQDVERLLRSTEIVRGMDEKKLVELVPEQSGLQYVGCPNCNGGRQERQLTWTIERPDEVVCRFCGHTYPSTKYPMQDAVVVRTPNGESARFEYWADDAGYRYFFSARRDDEVRKYLAKQALNLAKLFAATGDQAHARRAAVILDQFAQVFPGWCYHYDYPFRQKEIYNGDVSPEDFRSGFRTARWNWWAYHDIPSNLVEAYRLIRESDVFDGRSEQYGVDVAARIEHDLLRNAGEQVLLNRDECSNMSPSAWRSLVKLGRVVDEPRYIHEVVRRFRRLMEQKFFYDGYWYEGTPSYAAATISSLDGVLSELHGYSDPTGYVDPIDGVRFDDLDLEQAFPVLKRARDAVEKMRLPNGRLVPVHDTWANSRQAAPVLSAESYLLPALGHACLVGGAGPERSEFHLSHSGGYGHQHADMLSLLLFSHGHELLSDLGYTHTAYRSWTIATASHNTVVIDGLSQAQGSQKSPTDGSLRLFDLSNRAVQVVSADGVRAYPGLAKTYRRTVVVVDAGQQRSYAVDLFEVEGGEFHDYFLHGDADDPTEVSANVKLNELQSLLPSGFDWTPTKNEGEAGRAASPHYAYGFLRNLKSAGLDGATLIQVDFQSQERAGVGVRTTWLPEPGSQLVLGENPSIRLAQEDDSQLDNYQRPFMLLRHNAASGRSTFVAILEPYKTTPFIESVRPVKVAAGATALKIKIGNRIDLVAIAPGSEQSVAFNVGSGRRAHFRGKIGVLALHGGAVSHAYALGDGGWRFGEFELASPDAQQSTLTRTEQGLLVVSGTEIVPPPAGAVVRLLTTDGWVYPYTVKSTAIADDGRSVRLAVAEGPGLEYDATTKTLRLSSFPQREHVGEAYVEWNPSLSWSSEQPYARDSP